MHWLFGRARLLWSLTFLGGDVWTIVRWLAPDGLTMSLSLGAPEYAALIFLFTSGFCAVNWSWYQSLRPSRRFSGMYEEITRCRDLVHSQGVPIVQFGAIAFPSIAELRMQLHGLGIRTPEESPDSKRYVICWYNFLVHLASYARSGDLAGIRKNNDRLLKSVIG